MHENKRFVKTLKTVKIVQTWIYFILSNLKDKNLTRLYWSDFYCFLKFNTETVRFSNLIKKRLIPSKHINVESTLKQRWSSTFIDVVSRWYLVENESWADVHLSTLFQRWQNNVETTLIELHRFNVDEPTLFQRWNLVENESWANVCLSTWFQFWQNNVEATLIELRWFNVDDPMLFQPWY